MAHPTPLHNIMAHPPSLLIGTSPEIAARIEAAILEGRQLPYATVAAIELDPFGERLDEAFAAVEASK